MLKTKKLVKEVLPLVGDVELSDGDRKILEAELLTKVLQIHLGYSHLFICFPFVARFSSVSCFPLLCFSSATAPFPYGPEYPCARACVQLISCSKYVVDGKVVRLAKTS